MQDFIIGEKLALFVNPYGSIKPFTIVAEVKDLDYDGMRLEIIQAHPSYLAGWTLYLPYNEVEFALVHDESEDLADFLKTACELRKYLYG